MNARMKLSERKAELLDLAELVVKTKLPLKMVAHHQGVVLSLSEEQMMNNLIAVTLQDLRQVHYDRIPKGDSP